jgi:two-component system phosphate regulon sensor histidine kinase PhoR
VKLRTNITGLTSLLVLCALLLSWLLAHWYIRRELEAQSERELRSQMGHLSSILSRHNGVTTDTVWRDEFTSVAATFGLSGSLLSETDSVLWTFSSSGASPLSFQAGPEVARARRGVAAIEYRSANGDSRIYAAIPTNLKGLHEHTPAVLWVHRDDNKNTAVLDGVNMLFVIVGVVSLTIAVVLGWRESGRLSASVGRVKDVVHSLAGGNMEARIPRPTPDEIGDLARAINTMAQRLESDSEKARKLERIRSEFLANVSHELRTPIFSIQGFLETLLDGAVDDPAVNRQFLEKAHRHADRLNVLLSDLIEISRIESGEMKMSFRYFVINEFVRSVTDEMRPSAERKGLSLSVVSEVDPVTKVYGDKERLKQVLVNLIDNAIKYTDTGGAITCTVTEVRNMCQIFVEDTGCGIPDEHHARIFERFYRVDRDRSREVGGTGLGLAIAKHIVEAHEGTISVRSVVGKGSTFMFTLKR